MNWLCFLGFHFWQTKKEKHKVINHPNNREFTRIIVRECEHCGRREYIGRSFKKYLGFPWKKCTFDKDSIINIKEIN